MIHSLGVLINDEVMNICNKVERLLFSVLMNVGFMLW